MRYRDDLIKGMKLTAEKADPDGRCRYDVEPGVTYGIQSGWYRYRDGRAEYLYELVETGNLVWATSPEQAVDEFRIYHKL